MVAVAALILAVVVQLRTAVVEAVPMAVEVVRTGIVKLYEFQKGPPFPMRRAFFFVDRSAERIAAHNSLFVRVLNKLGPAGEFLSSTKQLATIRRARPDLLSFKLRNEAVSFDTRIQSRRLKNGKPHKRGPVAPRHFRREESQMKRYTLHSVSLLSLALAMASIIPQRAAADDDDPPGRVARLGYVRGNVSFEPAGTEDWVSAVINRPLTTGDKLWNDNDSFSELHLGSASIRLGSNTGFSFLNLTDNMTQVQLTEGTLNIRVRRLDDDETFEVDTPNLAFTLLRPGNYKVNVNEAGDATVIVVREGQGEVTGGGSAYTIHPEQVATFTGTDQIDADVETRENSSDDFDNWCSEREHRIDTSVSARYVSSDVIGYEDLDEYGGWRPTPEYGTVWFPHVTVVGWAPYHYGHWTYIAPWGYTWVDDAPWGFAPFHYGRWVVVDGVWGWVPAPPRPVVVGVAYVRPVYAPALVAWVGGPHFAVGVGVGGGFAAGVSVGWFPLGPREVYVPSYHVSRNYVNNVNVTNTTVNTTVVNNYYNTTVINKTTVNNVTYVNQRVPGAVSATTPQAFTSAQSVSKNAVKVDAREVATAQVVATTPTVAPSKQAVFGAGAVTRVRPPATIQTRAVVAKATPPPPPPSFVKQQQAIQDNGGKPLAPSAIRQMQPETAQARPTIKIAPPAKPQAIQAKGVQPNANRPVAPNNPTANNTVNKGGTPPVTNTNNKSYTDRPPSSRPNTPGNTINAPNTPNNTRNANTPNTANPPNAANPSNNARNVNPTNTNPQLDQKHQQQLQEMRAQQDLERQKVEQQQQKDRASLAKKAADDAAQQKLNQQHQQQLEGLERKHEAEAARLKQQQETEKKTAPKPPAKPPKEDKPPKKDK